MRGAGFRVKPKAGGVRRRAAASLTTGTGRFRRRRPTPIRPARPGPDCRARSGLRSPCRQQSPQFSVSRYAVAGAARRASGGRSRALGFLARLQLGCRPRRRGSGTPPGPAGDSGPSVGQSGLEDRAQSRCKWRTVTVTDTPSPMHVLSKFEALSWSLCQWHRDWRDGH